MLKKLFMLGAASALALTAVTAQAGASAYTIAKISGSVKVAYTDDGKTEGSTIIVKDGANNNGLIYLALGFEPGDKETAAAAKLAAKNAVLALAYGSSPYEGYLVVWDVQLQSIIGFLGSIEVSGSPVVAGPGENTAGKINAYAPAAISFYDECFGNSYLSGQATSLVHLTGTIDSGNHLTPSAISVYGLIGSAEDALIYDGGFKGNLGKPLSTTATFSCNSNNG